jgi:hypothetical protein
MWFWAVENTLYEWLKLSRRNRPSRGRIGIVLDYRPEKWYYVSYSQFVYIHTLCHPKSYEWYSKWTWAVLVSFLYRYIMFVRGELMYWSVVYDGTGGTHWAVMSIRYYGYRGRPGSASSSSISHSSPTSPAMGGPGTTTSMFGSALTPSLLISVGSLVVTTTPDEGGSSTKPTPIQTGGSCVIRTSCGSVSPMYNDDPTVVMSVDDPAPPTACDFPHMFPLIIGGVGIELACKYTW